MIVLHYILANNKSKPLMFLFVSIIQLNHVSNNLYGI